MSIKYMDRVWENPELKHGKLILMLALADHANDAGECWPSQHHLEKKTRLTSRQLRRVVTELITDGYLAVAEKGIGRGKKTLYRLFPAQTKADILSNSTAEDGAQKADISDTQKADKMSGKKKRTFLHDKSGNNVPEKADILDTKADISAQIPSHARSEPSIEPPEEPSLESSSSEDDEDGTVERDPLRQAWFEVYQAEMPADIEKAIAKHLGACSQEAVIHAIRASVHAKERTFSYLKTCAQNYIPPAPAAPARRYSVDIPGVIPMQPPARATTAARPAPPPLQHSDPWAVCLAELRPALPGMAVTYLEESTLAEAGMVNHEGKATLLYRVTVDGRAADALAWLTVQAGPAIRRKLGSVLGKPVLVEIVVAELEPVHGA